MGQTSGCLAPDRALGMPLWTRSWRWVMGKMMRGVDVLVFVVLIPHLDDYLSSIEISEVLGS